MGKVFAGPSRQIALGILLFLALTVLSDRFLRGLSLDLTEDGLYSLSPGSITVLKAQPEPITVDFYFSRKLAAPYPGLLAYGKRIEDLLRALEDSVPSRFDLSVIDPKPFSEAEDEAVALGMRGAQLGDGATLYMGLSIRDQLDGAAVIPFFSDEREAFLEYDIIKLVATLSETSKPKLGLITGLPMQFGAGGPQALAQGSGSPYAIYTQLTEFFAVETLETDFNSLEGYDLLLIVHPPALAENQLYQLEQYALKGGRMAIFVDPHAESLNPRATTLSSSNLPLLDSWGIDIPDGQILGDLDMAQRVQLRGPQGPEVKDYPLWIAANRAAINSRDLASAPIQSLNLASSGVVRLKENASINLTPLLSSSTRAGLYPAVTAIGLPDPDQLVRDFSPTGQTETLIARIEGVAQSRFQERAQASGGVQEGKLNLVVGADADLFEDRFWVQVQNVFGQQLLTPIAGNGSFILNVMDQMSGSDALLSLRARGISQRPFTVVTTLRREAEARYAKEEAALSEKMSATEARLQTLQEREGGSAVLSPEAEAEVERFRSELVDTRRALRDVRGGLRREIEALGARLAFMNTALVPIVICLIAGFVALRRRRRDATLG